MLGAHFSASKYLQIITQIISQSPIHLIETLSETLHLTWSQKQTVFLAGEGTCATSAIIIGEHMAEDLMRCDPANDAQQRVRFTIHGGRAAITNRNSKGDNCHLESLEKFARPDDLLIVLSPCAPSPEILRAVEWANSAGLITWALTGHNGVDLRKRTQHHLGVPLTDTGVVEAIHLLLMQWAIDDVSARIQAAGRYAKPQMAEIGH